MQTCISICPNKTLGVGEFAFKKCYSIQTKSIYYGSAQRNCENKILVNKCFFLNPDQSLFGWISKVIFEFLSSISGLRSKLHQDGPQTWATCFSSSLEHCLINPGNAISFRVLIRAAEQVTKRARNCARISTTDDDAKVFGDDRWLNAVL